jgi:hypothetical protein
MAIKFEDRAQHMHEPAFPEESHVVLKEIKNVTMYGEEAEAICLHCGSM